MTESFAIAFFRIYDRKIASGEITFSQTGMKKDDFTKLCTDSSYVLPRAEIERLCKAMKLTEDEGETLLRWAED
ncbi:hypothetical protein NE619_09305 [Anaerovorax odorimutans]|uniref:Uncharacterized protein n=1 Tax=Anaerovorax odorimutans TaxID=109327 RepID=A0ABT1RP11_9FIRM|nr:hypothetical protein [Anaerovorax odorimutans]MCQ4636927.1 hypothetical protein [Anaerovorax odorimutans]